MGVRNLKIIFLKMSIHEKFSEVYLLFKKNYYFVSGIYNIVISFCYILNLLHLYQFLANT